MGKMYLMCGLSGAGKTTFAKNFAKENDLCYLCIDDFYKEYSGGVYNEDTGFKVWIEFFKAIHQLEKTGRDILIDTNAPTFVKRQQFIDWFPSFDEYNLIYIAIDDEELRRRNNLSRGRVVPDEEMARMLYEFEEPFSVDVRGGCRKEKGWTNLIAYKNVNNHFIRMA